MMFNRFVQVACVGLSLMAVAATASAQSPTAAKRALIFSTIAQAADVTSTLSHPHWARYEANAMLPKNATGLVLAKSGVAILNVLVSKSVAQRHPRLMFWGQMTLGSTLSYVAYQNTRSGLRMRAR